MRRIHLFEFIDLPSCPRILRELATDYLNVVERTLKVYPQYADAAGQIADVMRRVGTDKIVDLCSGSGGPIPDVRRAVEQELAKPVHASLTDRYPYPESVSAGDERMSYVPQPIDAAAVPDSLVGMRTLFNGFHHFVPSRATDVLRDAVAKRAPIAVFEGVQRTWLMLILSFMVPLLVLLSFPFMRKRTVGRFLVTYIVPIAPLTILWDCIVSNLRAYTPDEMRALASASSAGNSEYHWEVGTTKVRAGVLTYLVGWPTKRANA